jgi:predicted MFS family arabinose efflux permease
MRFLSVWHWPLGALFLPTNLLYVETKALLEQVCGAHFHVGLRDQFSGIQIQFSSTQMLRPGLKSLTTSRAVVGKKQDERERVLRILASVTFLIFFQAYMVAPLIPRLAKAFAVSEERIGLIVPAYMLPYGLATLVYGVLADRVGRRRVLLFSLIAFGLLTALTAAAQSERQLITWRLATGLGASGVVPLALSLVGQLFPYEQRGRPLGWLFGSMAGGMAFGSTVGVLLEPLVGWRALFLGVAILAALTLLFLLPYIHLLDTPITRLKLNAVMAGYHSLLRSPRGLRTYIYVILNGVFHSGIYTWLGLYFSRRFHLGEVGIGIALLGYGVPGFFLGPVIGHAADCWGRRWIIPAGFGVAALAAALLAVPSPLLLAAVVVAFLSLGYDMTQPLLAGIVTQLAPERPGQAMGLNVFSLFTGFGLGSYLFGLALRSGWTAALILFVSFQLALALLAVRLFSAERVAISAHVPRGCSGSRYQMVR